PEQEGDPVACRRKPETFDPAGGLEEDLAGRKLQALLLRDLAGDREVLSVRSPVGLGDALDHLAGGAASREWDPRERARPVVERYERALEQHRDLALRGNGRDVGIPDFEARGVLAVRPRREEPDRVAVPGSAVHHGSAIRSEPGGDDRPAEKRQALEVGL